MSTTSLLPMEERMKHAADQLASGLTQEAYAKKMGLTPSSVGYWVSQYKRKQGIPMVQRAKPTPKPPTPRQEITHDELSDARAEIMALMAVRDELMGKLEDAETKVRSLMNVIILCGHQIGDV
jgi:transposase-like protein